MLFFAAILIYVKKWVQVSLHVQAVTFYSAYHQLTDINNVTIMHALYVLSLIIIACIIHVFFEF